MSYPQKPLITYSYSDFQLSQGNNAFPGTQVDNDLAVMKASLDATIDFVRGITRADGKLGNGTVTRDSLASDLLLGVAPSITAWTAFTAYRSGAIVATDNKLYSCQLDHTAGVAFSADLAAGKWVLIADFVTEAPGTDLTGTTLTISGLALASRYGFGADAATDSGVVGWTNTNGPSVELWGHGSSNPGLLRFKTNGTVRATLSEAGVWNFASAPTIGGAALSTLFAGTGANSFNDTQTISGPSIAVDLNTTANAPQQIKLRTGGTLRGYLGATSTNPFVASNTAGAAVFYYAPGTGLISAEGLQTNGNITCLSGNVFSVNPSNANQGAYHFGNSGTKYLFYDGTNFALNGGPLFASSFQGPTFGLHTGDVIGNLTGTFSGPVTSLQVLGGVGSLAFMKLLSGANVLAGTSYAGSGLGYSAADNGSGGGGPSGTWKALGYAAAGAATLYVRTA